MTTFLVRPLRTHYFLHSDHPVRGLWRCEAAIYSQSRQRPCKRFASSTSTTTITTPVQRHKVNGPLSTLPPPLNLPEPRKDGEPFFPKYAFKLGKSYATFYKDGIKAIYRNFMACRPIQKDLDNKYQGSLASAIDAGFLDRQRFQLLTRSWFDVKRVPIFAMVFLICGEFTPLVVIALTSVVPYTCRIPKQIESDRKSLEKRRAISFRNLTAPLPESSEGAKSLNRMQLLHTSWSLGLSSSAWDWLGGQLPGLPTPLIRRKVDRRIHYLNLDDKLIARDGGVAKLDIQEVKIALVERGVDVLGQNDERLRRLLEAWLNARKTWPIEKLLLTRPSVWPTEK
jgi:hypothetical protein